MEAEGDKLLTPLPQSTSDTVVDAEGDKLITPFPQSTSDTVVDNSSPAPVIEVNNYDPQKIVVKVNRDKTTSKALQISIGISDTDSIDLSISFDFSSLKTSRGLN
ncbi:hypothetical protein M8C21_021023, partial [Ambrosia artemisiifolia]